ncbi:hypothetical protein SBI67_12425 [Mycolicibacterium sp. 120266]|nr:hypothetical protein [Mycolicibacterium sp. 120266]MDX1872932.1 hypothetical protein [Mycolicibacterium sp. 120266]
MSRRSWVGGECAQAPRAELSQDGAVEVAYGWGTDDGDIVAPRLTVAEN